DELKKRNFDLIILDYELSGLPVSDVIQKVKLSQRTSRIPILTVSIVKKTDAHVEALDMGADDFLTKPFESKVLLAHVRSLVRIKRLNDETENFENVLAMMSSAVEAKDPYTRGHSERVSMLGWLIAREMGLDDKTQLLIKRAGLIHDIGKLVVDLSFINKPGKLENEEWLIMQAHPEAGARICAPLRSALPLLPLVRHHHEKLNGTGYPDGLVEDQIPLTVRIISVADVYDALTTDRPYRKAMSHEKAMDILGEEVKKECWDPDVFSVLPSLGLEELDAGVEELEAGA
ncbi:MAG: HD domain-containing protein, partial [Deltaproteobacteria bacterium]|nr:HD domain-containing protein [Deltaproteobacteria bacterium]